MAEGEAQQKVVTSEGDAKKVVLAIDGSEHAERALNFYLDTLHKECHVVHLVHALEYPYIPAQPYVRQEIVTELFDNAKKEAEKAEAKFKTILDSKQVPYVIHAEFAHPGEYICKVADQEQSMMVVMGTRGLGTIRRTIMGSVSDYVVHHAHCPVVVARH